MGGICIFLGEVIWRENGYSPMLYKEKIKRHPMGAFRTLASELRSTQQNNCNIKFILSQEERRC